MKKYILFPVVALLFASLFTACEKEDNDQSVEIKFSEIGVTTTSKTAIVSIRSPRVIVNGASQAVRSVGINYRAEGGSEWIKAPGINTADPEQYTIALDGLTPSTRYEYTVYAVTDSGTNLSDIRYFTTQDITLEASFGDMQLSASGDGLRLSVASVDIFVDEKTVKSDRCGAEYRAKGASQWVSVTSTTTDAAKGFTVDIAAASLTFDTVYEVRAWIEVGDTRVYSQRIVERLYENSKFQDIMGDWRLDEWHGSTDLQFAIYLSVTADGEFKLWQQLQSVEWQKFSGTITFEDGMVTGVYSDGQTWSASYSVERDGERMIWTSTADATDRSVYVPAAIPDYLRTMNVSSATRSTERFL